MPLKIPNDLPASGILAEEGVFVMPETRAFTQDIRPLRIAVFNIMPTKPVAETQLLRLLSRTPLQVTVTLLHPQSHICKTTPPEHLARFYKSFADVRNERFDCLIITGAPVETLAFEDVTYWKELQEVMEWSKAHVYSTLHICWGAQAGLYHHYGIPKHVLPRKMSGVFPHMVLNRRCPLLFGFDSVFHAPHSRHTETRREDLDKAGKVEVLAESSVAGIYLAHAEGIRRVFVTGHPEYDQFTLQKEFLRDLTLDETVVMPENYFPDDNIELEPVVNWRSHASLLFSNWLNFVYQEVPFDLERLEPLS